MGALTFLCGFDCRFDVKTERFAFGDFAARAGDCLFEAGRHLVFPPVHSFTVTPDKFICGVESPVSVVLEPFCSLFGRHLVAEILFRVWLAEGEVMVHVKCHACAHLALVFVSQIWRYECQSAPPDGVVSAEVLFARSVVIGVFVSVDELRAIARGLKHADEEVEHQPPTFLLQSLSKGSVGQMRIPIEHADVEESQDCCLWHLAFESAHELSAALADHSTILRKRMLVCFWLFCVVPEAEVVRFRVKANAAWPGGFCNRKQQFRVVLDGPPLGVIEPIEPCRWRSPDEDEVVGEPGELEFGQDTFVSGELGRT